MLELQVLKSNWAGAKPKGNYIYGSNLQLGFDEGRIKINSGFSLSLLNTNKWNKIQSITELDTLAFDTTLDGNFLDFIEMDANLDLSK